MSEKAVIAVLKRARAVIEDPAHWTQNAYARDKNGSTVLENSPEAVSFCLAGALIRVTTGCKTPACWDARHVLSNVTNGITDFNDTHTHAEVLSAIDTAIANLEVA